MNYERLNPWVLVAVESRMPQIVNENVFGGVSWLTPDSPQSMHEQLTTALVNL